MLLFILALCGFSGALATRLFDPLITSIVADFATPVSVVAFLRPIQIVYFSHLIQGSQGEPGFRDHRKRGQYYALPYFLGFPASSPGSPGMT